MNDEIWEEAARHYDGKGARGSTWNRLIPEGIRPCLRKCLWVEAGHPARGWIDYRLRDDFTGNQRRPHHRAGAERSRQYRRSEGNGLTRVVLEGRAKLPASNEKAHQPVVEKLHLPEGKLVQRAQP